MAEKKSKVAEIKTKPTAISVADFINAIDNEQKRKDSFAIVEMMKKATGDAPIMWGGSIIGFGNKRYKSPASGREVDWFRIGFSPRKASLTMYFMGSYVGKLTDLEKLGKHKTNGGCIYINKLDDVDLDILNQMMISSLKANE